MKDFIYIGSVMKCIVALQNGNEIRMERLAGEVLPGIGEKVYPYWDAQSAVLIHTKADTVFKTIENAPLAV